MNNQISKKSPVNRLSCILYDLNRESTTLVTFGKYKNKTYEVVCLDTSYCAWIRKQHPANIEMLLLQQFIEKMNFMTGYISKN
jgi:hypothetical protein